MKQNRCPCCNTVLEDGKAINLDWCPAYVDKEVMRAFVLERKRMRKPLTPEGIKRLIDKLDKLYAAGQDVTACINESLSNGWTGVFASKETRRPKHENLTEKQYTDEAW